MCPWFMHIRGLLALQEGGYPFGAGDLDFEVWQDIGELKRLLDDRRETQRMTLMMRMMAGRS